MPSLPSSLLSFSGSALLALAAPAAFADAVFVPAARAQGAAARPAPVAAGDAGLFALVSGKPGATLVRLPVAGRDGVMARYLYTPSIAAGIGSPDLWLDRARLGATQILLFRKVGGTVVAEFENNRFRALNGDPGEGHAVAMSFAASPIWSTPVVQEDGTGIVVDLSGLLLRDAMGVAERLRGPKGAYRPAPALSRVDPEQSRAFPDNAEFEAVQTFAADAPLAAVARVVPDGRAVTLRVHHSFLRLPDAGFRPRAHDPRTGTSAQVIRNDYSARLDQPIVSRLARRFRLEKTDPAAARSPVRKPIVFYVDRAMPVAIRDALQQGAQWWAQAFDAAGFENAFRVEILPEGVNSMDARYNVIAWVHRETRGWSTGSTIVDPRTGEIVRGVVQLGSLRAWQDKLIFEALAGAAREGTGAADDPIELVKARLRQLAVHEVGHALGLSHNFAGSTFADRASVMDYPPPRIAIRDGALDFSDAYARGVGAWDRFAIDWLYRQYAPGTDEAAALDALARAGQARGYRFVADGDTRGDGDAQPWGNMWDDGDDAAQALDHVMAVRRIALARFGPGNLPRGAAAADLQRLLVPLYLFHRYEVTAASKLIGGVDYGYAVAGDGHEAATVVAADRQRAALKALLATLDPAALDVPDGLLPLLSSVQSGVPDRQAGIELLPGRTAAAFDWGQAAETAADITLAALLAPERLNRLALQGSDDAGQVSLADVLAAVTDRVLMPGGPGRRAEIARRVRARYALRLLALGDGGGSAGGLSSTALAVVRGEAGRLATRLSRCGGDRTERDQCALLASMLAAGPQDRAVLAAPVAAAPDVPPGAPIGEDQCWLCGLGEPAGGPARPAPDEDGYDAKGDGF